jgi:rubrerythrin
MASTGPVWFCTACDDQAPWLADEPKPCPTCGSKEHVEAAKRFSNLEAPRRD